MIPELVAAIVAAAEEAYQGGTPGDAIIAAIKGAQAETSRAAIVEELNAAEKRKASAP